MQTQANTFTSGDLSAQTVTDALGNETHTTFDSTGNKTAVTDAYGTSGASMTSYGFDSSNHLTSLIDPKGNGTDFT